MRGQDAQYRLEVDFLDAVNGTKTRITLPDGGTLDVTIPAGVTDGQVLRLKGKGMPGMGEGEPGDALVEITVRPHPVFKREGDDIIVEVPITFDEAVLGGKVEVPTIGGPRVRDRAARLQHRPDAETEGPRHQVEGREAATSWSSSRSSCRSGSTTSSRASPKNGARSTATIRDAS